MPPRKKAGPDGWSTPSGPAHTMEAGSPRCNLGAAGIATADFSVALKKNKARNVGRPSRLVRLILVLVDQPFRSCAEPFDDSAWLSNSSSPSLSAGEWDKTPLPAHSPIFLSNLPLLRHV